GRPEVYFPFYFSLIGYFMKFCILRSGSSGNCTFIEHRNTRILLDAGGMSRKKLVALLEEIDIAPESIDAVVNTHVHYDHLNRSTLSFCRTFRSALYLHSENNSALLRRFDQKCRKGVQLLFFDHGVQFDIGPVRFEPFEVSHDAAGVTSGFRFYGSDQTVCCAVGYAADLGHAPDSVISSLLDCEYLCLEANHDPDLLWKNPRRTYLHKKRVTGRRGHLSNLQSARAIEKLLDGSQKPPRNIILCHLSADHNSPQLALEQINAFLGEKIRGTELSAALRHCRTSFFGEKHIAVKKEPEPSQLNLFETC
ncbi:MAG: MBL fold metallo-hydrolase, partial [Chitinispirillaceae bacterium]